MFQTGHTYQHTSGKLVRFPASTKYYFSLGTGPFGSWHEINTETSLQLAQVHTGSLGPLFTKIEHRNTDTCQDVDPLK
jgi:hypothetical protein